MRDFKTREARNTKTFLGRIGTSTPVFGLRPIRSPFLRTVKLPKDEIFTFSPFTRVFEISSRTASTSSADSLRDKPTSLYTESARSARVIVRVFIISPLVLCIHRLSAHLPNVNHL